MSLLTDYAQVPEQVAALQARVEELEARARPGDQLQPNYLTVDQTGKIGAAFTGHLAAAGVDLKASDQFNDGPDRKVRWLDANGGLVAEIGAYETPSYKNPLLVLYAARNAASGEPGEARLNAEGTSYAELQVRASDATAGYGRVVAIVGGQQRVILDDRGYSDFTPPPNYTQIQAGVVSGYYSPGTGYSAYVNLGRAWSTHLAFVGAMEAKSGWPAGTQVRGSGILDNSTGFILFDNSQAQNIQFSFISIGY